MSGAVRRPTADGEPVRSTRCATCRSTFDAGGTLGHPTPQDAAQVSTEQLDHAGVHHATGAPLDPGTRERDRVVACVGVGACVGAIEEVRDAEAFNQDREEAAAAPNVLEVVGGGSHAPILFVGGPDGHFFTDVDDRHRRAPAAYTGTVSEADHARISLDS